MKSKLEKVTTLTLSLDAKEIKTLEEILECFFDKEYTELDDEKLWNEMNHLANDIHNAINAIRYKRD
jgi:hypothetical protein